MADEKIDPVHATGMMVVADENGIALLFNRPVHSVDTTGDQPRVTSEIVPSAAVHGSWGLAQQMHAALGSILEQREAAIAAHAGKIGDAKTVN